MKRLTVQFGALLLVFVAFAVFFSDAGAEYGESTYIGKDVEDFDTLSNRFKELAKEKGAEYAFEVLRRADLPLDTDLHLLGHTVGDELYEQEGVDGIGICTQEFRNACSHSIVIGLFNEYGGESALEKIRAACAEAPGGSGAYTMCYHGLGHGVLAFYGFDLAPTVAVCGKTGTEEYQNREYTECVGGAVMELMGGGGHDRESWIASREKYLGDDPLAPCSSSVIPEAAKEICFLYITPRLFELAGADLARPAPEHFAAAFESCDTISQNTPRYRGACFSGVGKEFPGLALGRDIRALNTASNEQLVTMRSWCTTAPHQEAYEACVNAVISSLFWGGENDVRLSIRFCSLMLPLEVQPCFNSLFVQARLYLQPQEHAEFCDMVPSEARSACTSQRAV